MGNTIVFIVAKDLEDANILLTFVPQFMAR